MRIRSLLLASLLLAGCAGTPPIESAGTDPAIQPQTALERAEELRGRSVLWGGVIVEAVNLARDTRLEILAYPLDGQRPDTGAPPLRRFLAYHSGYLETADYRRGRRVTLRGRLAGVKVGRVGEAEYEFPVVEIERIHLWPESRRHDADEPRFHIGIGVLFGG